MIEMPRLAKRPDYARIAFTGPMASGKTYLARYAEKNIYTYAQVLSFASKLKAIAYELYGPIDKNGDGRTLLQELGDDLRKYDPDVFIKYLLQDIIKRESYNIKPAIIIDDLRYENEAIVLRKNGFKIIQVTNTDIIRRGRLTHLYPNMPAGAESHASEALWKGTVADHTVLSDDIQGAFDLKDLLSKYETTIDR